VPVVRSILFNLFYVLWTLGLGLLYLPLLAVPGRMGRGPVRLWSRGILGAARVLLGIRWRVEGADHLPAGPCILAAKHQSAWETFFLHLYLSDPVYVLKKELLSIPFVGWYMRKTGMIAVDRAAGAGALKRMLRQAEAVLGAGRQIIIFPEGTRVAPDETRPYHPGVAALYGRFGAEVPVIPVALNSGLVWGRNSFVKRPGEVVVRILPPLPGGQSRKAFLSDLQARLDQASRELCQGAPPAP
jgi:1-acyl-sn-glycerol-3-phosphate acyltransferase